MLQRFFSLIWNLVFIKRLWKKKNRTTRHSRYYLRSIVHTLHTIPHMKQLVSHCDKHLRKKWDFFFFYTRLKQPSSLHRMSGWASLLQLATRHYCPSWTGSCGNVLYFITKSQTSHRHRGVWLLPSAFNHWNLKQLKCKKVRSHTVS